VDSDATPAPTFVTFGNDAPVDSPLGENPETQNSASQMVLEGRIRFARWEGFEPPAA